jgi:hypothetical protein
MAHRLRNLLLSGEGASAQPPAPSREDRRQREAAPAAERRKAAQRGAERHRGLAEHAAIVVRGKRALVRVVNLSPGGVTIESGLTPAVGETVSILLPNADLASATVRWVRGGRIGLAWPRD